ncbi:MAG: GTP-binding protein HflX [Fusobacteriales bacterium]|jgi:hypothetical protein|nr:GTP-binding protein HflX [Fusobacteriales bacterium]
MRKIVLYFIVTIFFYSCNKFSNNLSTDTLRKYADKSNILIGATIEPNQLEDVDFNNILKNEFNFVTPENAMKWGFIHPERYKFDFTNEISALNGDGLDTLIKKIENKLFETEKKVEMLISFSEANIASYILDNSRVITKEYNEKGILITTFLNEKDYNKYKKYIIKNN